MIAVACCLAARWALTWPARIQAATALGCFAVLLSLWLCSISPAQALAALEQTIESSRPGASESRNEVYEASWRGIRQAPLLGHGWPGVPTQEEGSVYGDEQNTMVVGSHSTISGLLYTGGAITFCAFLLAVVRIGVALLRRSRSDLSRDGLAILIAILLTSTSEGLESLVFPTLFVFLWLGVALVLSDPMESQHAYNS